MQGGSTLTQQLAKNLFLTQERTASRKIQEAILALWLEHKYSKTQILELYLNRVYFGSGAYGVEAAAQKYFGHGARNVTLPEAAILAGLMKAPARLAPNRNPAGAAERAEQVVEAMRQEGFITDAMALLALAHPAQAIRDQNASSINYAADFVMDSLDDTIGAIDEDITVSTTLDSGLQGAAEKALTEALDRKGASFNVGQGAFVALAPDGAIKALVGGRNYADSQFNRAVSAKRQPGSAFKPFVYLAALETGLNPELGARGRADQCEGLAAGKLLARIFRPGYADEGVVALLEYGGGTSWPRSRPKGDRPGRAPAWNRCPIFPPIPPSRSAHPRSRPSKS